MCRLYKYEPTVYGIDDKSYFVFDKDNAGKRIDAKTLEQISRAKK